MADVKNKEAKVKKKNFFVRVWAKIRKFVKELVIELKKVSWPTKQQVFKNTGSVLIFCALVGAIIWITDFLLKTLVSVIYG